jgi:hypothetical protein
MAAQRKTSSRVAKVASSLLRSERTSKPAKTVAASSLSQRAPKPSTRRKK